MSLQAAFVAEATGSFQFLVNEFGFQLESARAPHVVYRSEKFLVRIYYNEEWHHELSLTVARVGDADTDWPDYGLAEFRAIAEGGPRIHDYLEPQTQEQLRDGLHELADQVRRFCSQILMGKEDELRRIDLMRAEYGMQRDGYGTLKRRADARDEV